MPDKACETLDLLLKHGKTPTSYSLSALVDAYARASQPLKAQRCFDAMIAEHGLTPTITNWNALLGAYAKSGHKVDPLRTLYLLLCLENRVVCLTSLLQGAIHSHCMLPIMVNPRL